MIFLVGTLMPVGNKPSIWKDDETLNLARRFGIDNTNCFPKQWRSCKKITIDDVKWLINQIYMDYPSYLQPTF